MAAVTSCENTLLEKMFLGNERQPEATFLYSWAVLLPKCLGKSSL